MQIVDSTPVWDGLPFSYSGGGTEEPAKAKGKPVSIRCPILINPNELTEKEIDWLWFNKIPAGTLNLLTGLAGNQKTFWTVYLASVITNGWNWPDGFPCQQGSVLFFYGEDDLERGYKPRLRANGADQSKNPIL